MSQLKTREEGQPVAGGLVSSLTRDMAETLKVISGQAETLLRRLPEDQELQAPARAIRDAADRAMGAAQRILGMGRSREIKPIELELNTVLRQMQAPLQRLIGENIELHLDLEPDTGSIVGDPAQVQRAILNLVLNARDAMPRGGRLFLETRSVATAGLPAGAQDASRPHLALTVRDEGCGMDEAGRSRLFQPFVSTKGSGRGLGLFVVQGIVEQCGGCIEVESERERGTCVRLYLPTTGDPEPADALAAEGAAGGTVLLVVDDEDIRTVLVAMLDLGGYSTLAFANARDALRSLEQYPGPLSLLVTETALPGSSGRELARRVEAARPGTPVLYLTSYDGESWLRAEGLSFLSKPLSVDMFLRGVRGALRLGDKGGPA